MAELNYRKIIRHQIITIIIIITNATHTIVVAAKIREKNVYENNFRSVLRNNRSKD